MVLLSTKKRRLIRKKKTNIRYYLHTRRYRYYKFSVKKQKSFLNRKTIFSVKKQNKKGYYKSLRRGRKKSYFRYYYRNRHRFKTRQLKSYKYKVFRRRFSRLLFLFFARPHCKLIKKNWRKSKFTYQKQTSLNFIFYKKKFKRKSRYKYLRFTRPFNLFWVKRHWNYAVGTRSMLPYYDFVGDRMGRAFVKKWVFSKNELKVLRNKTQSYTAELLLAYRFRKSFLRRFMLRRKSLRRFRYYFRWGQYFGFRVLRSRWLTNLYFKGTTYYFRDRWGRLRRWQPRRFFDRWKTRQVKVVMTRARKKIQSIPYHLYQKKGVRSLSDFLSLNRPKFQDYYKFLLHFKRVVKNFYFIDRHLNRRRWYKLYRGMNHANITYNFPRKKAVLFFKYFEFQLPMVLVRFFFIKKIQIAMRIIQTHGVLVNNKLSTKLRSFISVGDLIECSMKSYLWFEPYFQFVLSMSRGSVLSWIYTYCFVVNCIFLIGIYYRLPNPIFISFNQILAKKKKRKFLNFFIEYCYKK